MGNIDRCEANGDNLGCLMIILAMVVFLAIGGLSAKLDRIEEKLGTKPVVTQQE